MAAPPPPPPAFPASTGDGSKPAPPTSEAAAGPADVDFARWLMARGVSDAEAQRIAPDGECVALRVGEPAEEALACGRSEHVVRAPGGSSRTGLVANDFYRIVQHREIVVVRSAVPHVVLDVVEAVIPMDCPVAKACDVVRLALRLSPDGRAATLVDKAGSEPAAFVSRDADDILSCAAGRARVAALGRADRGYARIAHLDSALADRACAGLGRYAWRAGRFGHN